MKLMPISEFRAKLSQVVEAVSAGEVVVITNAGAPKAVLMPCDEEELEDLMLFHDPELRRSIEEAGRQLAAGKGIPLDVIIEETKRRLDAQKA